MKIFNSLTKEKEVFTPLKENTVGMYHCGPTVYWTQHIGNMRAVVMVDIINRTFNYLGYDVALVRNYTDVGHLTGDNDGDADTGIDRMEKAAQRESLSPEKIAQKYIDIYESDRTSLNTLEPVHAPKATDHIQEMIDIVQILLDKGFAYTTDLAVYFDVSKKEDYTKLSGQDLEKQFSGSGHGDVHDPDKKHPADFALWFFKAGSHAHALQTWPSPFINSSLVENGEGFPGWHIECSAMSHKYLGDTFDIHMGGVEHIPIHHTNEIAQSESAHDGKPMAHFWLHNEHLLVDGGKMSKSEGTSYTLNDITEKGFSPIELRFFFLQAHYRSKQNFTWDALDAAHNGLEKIYRDIMNLREQSHNTIGTVDQNFKKQFIEKISDDFNTPQALAVFHELLKSEIAPADKLATIYDFDHVLGLKLESYQPRTIEIPAEVQSLLDQRQQARDEKNWELSDQLRDQIAEMGFEVKDGKDGQEVVKK